jgi:hypothetical protein
MTGTAVFFTQVVGLTGAFTAHVSSRGLREVERASTNHATA